MGRTRIVLLAIAAALTLALAAFYLQADRAKSSARIAPANPAVSLRADSTTTQPRASAEISPRSLAESPPVAASPDYATQFRTSADLLTFIESIEPAAEAGDVDAQHYVALASRRCTHEYPTLFNKPATDPSLDAALAANLRAKQHEHLARKIFGQCQRFRAEVANPFTDRKELLARAAGSGSGAAKALLAFDKQNEMIATVDPALREQLDSEIRTLARDAIRSKDPEVVYRLAFIAAVTNTGKDAASEASVWIIAACQRGRECGSDTDEFQYFCQWDPACQPFETVVDLFRRRTGARFDELQLRANELNAKLDQDRFEEIGL